MRPNETDIYKMNRKLNDDHQPETVTEDIENVMLFSDTAHSGESIPIRFSLRYLPIPAGPFLSPVAFVYIPLKPSL